LLKDVFVQFSVLMPILTWSPPPRKRRKRRKSPRKCKFELIQLELDSVVVSGMNLLHIVGLYLAA
jgi:hypothetical protein